MFKKITFGTALLFFSLAPLSNATKASGFLKDLQAITEHDIHGPGILPLADASDGTRYHGTLPTKIIPFEFTSKLTLPALTTPLDVASVFHHPELLANITVKAYLTLPAPFDLASSEKYPLAVFLHSSAGLTPYEYETARYFNDQGIAVCIIDYANEVRGCKKKYVANQLEFNVLMPAIDSYTCLNVLGKAPFINHNGYALAGFSLGGTAALRAANLHFREIFSPDKQPYSLYLVAGALPVSQLLPEQEISDPRCIVVAYHGTQDTFCRPEPMENFAQYSYYNNIRLELIESAGHCFWTGKLSTYGSSPEMRRHFKRIPPKENSRKNILTKSLEFVGTSNHFEVEYHDGSGRKDKITYKGLTDPSGLTHTLPSLEELKRIPAVIIGSLNEGNIPAVAEYLDQNPLYVSPDASTSRLENIKDCFEHIQNAFKVNCIALGSPKMGKLLPISQLPTESKPYNPSIDPDRKAAGYMNKNMVKHVKSFCGQPWGTEHYRNVVDLTWKGHTNSERRNIVKTDLGKIRNNSNS